MGVPKETLDRGLYWRNQAFITEFYHPLSRKQRLRQNPNERVYTFWDYMRNAYGRNAGLRLDHFLLNPKVADRLINAFKQFSYAFTFYLLSSQFSQASENPIFFLEINTPSFKLPIKNYFRNFDKKQQTN
jgi:hypothetical protein